MIKHIKEMSPDSLQLSTNMASSLTNLTGLIGSRREYDIF